ncbi:hypothetical protein, partial [Helicobacter pylori]|uniref:hypothetical protein n=1 Tax=Helicobacter pylori TaxID=210 RepID=UPI00139408FC
AEIPNIFSVWDFCLGGFKDTTCLGLFEIMDSTAKLIQKDKEVVRIREMCDALVNYPIALAVG